MAAQQANNDLAMGKGSVIDKQGQTKAGAGMPFEDFQIWGQRT